MTYAQLRKKLRGDGFINAEIAAIHMQYLMMRAGDITDDEMVFDREHGLLVAQSARVKMEAMRGKRIAPDVKYHCAYILDGDHRTRVGPFT